MTPLHAILLILAFPLMSISLNPGPSNGLFNLSQKNLNLDPQISIAVDTQENSANEWAADMTAQYEDWQGYSESVTWFIKGQFSNYQWIEATYPTGPNNQYLTVEQVYGYCFDVYIIVDYDGFAGPFSFSTDVYTICYVLP